MGGRKILLWNRYGDQMYLAWSRKHNLSEMLDILAYIQRMNYEACPSYELSVMDICRMLVDCFGFGVQDTNYYELTRKQVKQLFGKVKRLNYSVPSKNLGEETFVIELSDFWELYHTQSVPKETIENSEIAETIEAMVREDPNAQPWL